MKIKENYDLTLNNSYRIKAICECAYFPCCELDFIELYGRASAKKNILLGGGFNVILSKSFYDEAFVIVGEDFSKVQLNKGNEIEAEAGTDLKVLSEYALSKGLSGLEIFYDIPSSLGGAVVMNAGASGEEIKDILIKVRYLDLQDMEVKEIFSKDMRFAYRDSFFQRNTNKIILKAWLKLKKSDSQKIQQKMERNKRARWAKQPKELPNAGSVFKRPEGYYVGAMIDELGLKGFAVGGAKISEKHGGFIVNFDGANGEDILNLIKEIKSRVHQKFGVKLKVEQRVI